MEIVFEIISNDLRPFEDNGLFQSVQQREYVLDQFCDKEKSIQMAQKWFAHQLKQYGVGFNAANISVGVAWTEGDVDASRMYYLACKDVEAYEFPYTLLHHQNALCQAYERQRVVMDELQENINYVLERYIAA